MPFPQFGPPCKKTGLNLRNFGPTQMILGPRSATQRGTSVGKLVRSEKADIETEHLLILDPNHKVLRKLSSSCIRIVATFSQLTEQ